MRDHARHGHPKPEKSALPQTMHTKPFDKILPVAQADNAASRPRDVLPSLAIPLVLVYPLRAIRGVTIVDILSLAFF